MWTITAVKDLLPPVRIRRGTQDAPGTITGHRLPYAMVSIGETGSPFTWSTITRALHTGRALSDPAPQGQALAGRAPLPSPAGDRHA